MEKALEIILNKLDGVKFALVGSFNLQTQGIDIKANDLDLLTDDENIEKIAQIFGSKVTNERIFKETNFMINKEYVQVVSNQNNDLRVRDLDSEIIIVEKNGMKIPCMSLESELYFYSNSGREMDKLKPKLIKAKIQEFSTLI